MKTEDEKYLLADTIGWLRRMHDWYLGACDAAWDGTLTARPPEPPKGVDLAYRKEGCSIDYNGEVYKPIPRELVRSHLEIANYLKGFICVRCHLEVEEGRRYPTYQEPTCHACLPPPAPWKYV